MDIHTMLNEIRKSADMGVAGIEAVEQKTAQPLLRTTLGEQKQEYNEIYNRADCLLMTKGGQRQNISALTKRAAKMASDMKLMMGKSDAKIAEMMVEGNTRGMIKSYQNIRAMEQTDAETMALSRKLLDTELHNIEQMKKFL